MPGAAGGSALAGCRAPHPDWLSGLPWQRGSPEPAAGAPARCCCGSSRLRCVLPAKYLVVFSQLEGEMCIALAGKTFAAKALCVCVKGRWSTSNALGHGTHGAGSPGCCCTLAVAAGRCSTGQPCRVACLQRTSNHPPGVGRLWLWRHLWAEVRQPKAQLEVFCTQELPGVRVVVSPGLAGDGFRSSSSEFLICAGVGWHGHNTEDSLGAQQRAGEQSLSQEAATVKVALKHQ